MCLFLENFKNVFISNFRVPLQAPPRRKSKIVVMNQKHDSGNDLADIQSPNSTITSVNSISSLLKEKLQLSIPQALRSSKKRQNDDYRLIIIFYLLIIIFLSDCKDTSFFFADYELLWDFCFCVWYFWWVLHIFITRKMSYNALTFKSSGNFLIF